MKLRVAVLTPVDVERVVFHPDAVVELGADGRIVRVTPDSSEEVDEDLRPSVLLPGFVDGHVHWPQTRIVGSASGPLLDWLERSTFPEEARFADPAHALDVIPWFTSALARNGTTLALAYGPVFPEASDALFAHAARRGLKLISGPVLMDEHCPDALRLPADRALPELEALAARWHGREGLEVAVIPRFALSCSPAMLSGAGRLAERLGLRVTTHLSENPVECRIAEQRFGTPDYLRVYEDAGLVRPGAVFAHCLHPSASEWDRLAAAGAVVAHCPDSNDFLGSGGLTLGDVDDRRLPIVIGSDVAAGRSFRIPRILSSAYDNSLRQGRPLSPERLLWLGTRGGALALGHAETGFVAPGFDADLCLFRPPPWATDARGVLASLLFDHDAGPMQRTWVRGRLVWDAAWFGPHPTR